MKEANFMVSSTEILNANILIVDDQEANVQLLEQLLHEAGYTGVASTTIRTRSARCIARTTTT